MSGLDKWLPPLESGAGIAAVGLVGGLLKRWRHRARFGRVEDEALVAKLVERAVSMQGEVLEDLRQERIDDRQYIGELRSVVTAQRTRIDKLEHQVAELASERGGLRSELAQVKRELDACLG